MSALPCADSCLGPNQIVLRRLAAARSAMQEAGIECLLITGQSADYQLKVVVPDMEYYQQFLLNKITRIEGVSDVHSSFMLREVQNSTELPLTHLQPR